MNSKLFKDLKNYYLVNKIQNFFKYPYDIKMKNLLLNDYLYFFKEILILNNDVMYQIYLLIELIFNLHNTNFQYILFMLIQINLLFN